jgi:succinyl-diaminopimelate desuccinylase
LDTVRTENGPARVDGDRLFGSGSSDMKSGLAVMLALAETVSELPCDVTLVFYAREEGPFAENELGPVLEQDRDLATLDLAVCMEPSDNKLHLGCNGSLHAELTFVGRTAHSARPWEGENAVMKAATFLADVAARAPEPVDISGVTYRSVFTVTQAKDGGRGRNVVPDRFVVNLNHRFAPTYSIEQAKARVSSARARARGVRRAGRRAEASVDGCRAFLRARDRSGEFRTGRERAGPPEERVHVARTGARRIRDRAPLAHVSLMRSW